MQIPSINEIIFESNSIQEDWFLNIVSKKNTNLLVLLCIFENVAHKMNKLSDFLNSVYYNVTHISD